MRGFQFLHVFANDCYCLSFSCEHHLDVKQCVSVVLVGVSLIASDEHLFVCTLSMSRSLKEYLLKSFAHILIELSTFLLLRCKYSSHSPVQIPCQIQDLKIFYPVLRVVLSFY